MNLTSKKASLVILGLTALTFSRALFFAFNDPEGPNLLVVTGMAVILYLLSVPAFLFNSSATGLRKLLLTIALQILIVLGFYVVLK